MHNFMLKTLDETSEANISWWNLCNL